eukprot:NODE_2625_length_413_cov_15.673077_g2544_i0.p1 GENE.NODE_2625_length_413_cov_15.673077_g2544_i0~~NODE_2625_length_413_cov_15.673077_g2544_i0.p1  ORF type:complete len:63 (+),score=5.12 NODE_2625_length_413_cov_15.673077_g2544_i0:223-411(+)
MYSPPRRQPRVLVLGHQPNRIPNQNFVTGYNRCKERVLLADLARRDRGSSVEVDPDSPCTLR